MYVDQLRRRRLPLIAGAAALFLFALIPTAASAERYPPAPQPDDFAFVQLGSVGEMVTAELYRAGGAGSVLSRSERSVFRRLASGGEKEFKRLNGLLGEDAIGEGDFAVRIPGAVLRSRQQTLALAVRFERLLNGLYLSAVQSTLDPPTRLLMGRQLAVASRNLAVLRDLRGGKLNLKAPKPLSVQYVGIQFDRYLAIPGA